MRPGLGVGRLSSRVAESWRNGWKTKRLNIRWLLVLSGMLFLFMAMALAIVAMLLLMRPRNTSGDTFVIFAKLLEGLYLPLIGTGMLVRSTNAGSSPSTDTDTDTDANDPSPGP